MSQPVALHGREPVLDLAGDVLVGLTDDSPQFGGGGDFTAHRLIILVHLDGDDRRGALRARDSYCELVRTAFHDQLDALTQTLGQMCGLAGLAMERATQALLQADLVLVEQVITDHDPLALMRAKAEDDTFVLPALQAPVASDLRVVVSAMQNAADVERMGALVLHVAKIARRRHPRPKKLLAASPKWAASQSNWATAQKMLC